MDKKIKVLLVLLVGFVQFSFAQSYLAEINKQATQMLSCFKTGDYACLLRYTHPKVVTAMGGQKSAVEKLSKQMKEMKDSGAEFSHVSVEPVLQHLVSEKTIQCIVPQIVEIKFQGQTVKARSFLFGITYNNGKNWYFIDVGRQPEAQMRKLLPEMSKKIVLRKEEKIS